MQGEWRLVAGTTQATMAGTECGGGRWFHGAVLSTVTVSVELNTCIIQTSYPANHDAAALAVAHHVSGTFPHAPTRELSPTIKVGSRFAKTCAQLGAEVQILVAAVQRVLDQLAAVLEQVGAELPACPRQVMERVEVELAGELADYSAQSMWLACIEAWSQVRVCGQWWLQLTDNSSGQR